MKHTVTLTKDEIVKAVEQYLKDENPNISHNATVNSTGVSFNYEDRPCGGPKDIKSMTFEIL